MKENLFRGKRKDNGKWTEGYFYKIWNKTFILWGMTGDNPNMEEVIPETVGQYAVLTDKNGKKIFEGDTVKRSTAPLKDEELSIFYNGTHACYAMKSNYGCIYEPISDFGAIEVIGNIYDNREILYEN